MDTFTTLAAITTLAFIYFGEKFKVGAYLIIAATSQILFAWRMGETVFYFISAGVIITLTVRAFFSNDDVREPESEDVLN